MKQGPTVIITHLGCADGTWCFLVGLLIDHLGVLRYLWQNAKVPQ